MTRCDTCRPLLLDHLYGLLDPVEAAGVDAHLARCPDCAAARDRAARTQQLFARAAKSPFPDVRFVPPAEPPAATALPPAPAAEPTPPTQPRRAGGVWWAVAASLLVLIPAAAVPVVRAARDRDDARAALELADAGLSAARQAAADRREARDRERAAAAKAVEDARRESESVLARWDAAERAAEAAEKARKIHVEVVGPPAVQPGAPNEFAVLVQDQSGAPGTHHFEAQVQAGKKVVLSQRLDPERNGGRTHLRLPADLWEKVAPDADLSLAITAVDEKTGARSVLRENVRLLGPVYSTFLTTDKPLYRPGDVVRFRSLTLDRTTFRPPAREQALRFELRRPDGGPVPGTEVEGLAEPVKVTDGKLRPVPGPDGKPVRGVGCGEIVLPADLPSGEYTLLVSELPHPAGYPPAPPAARRLTVKAFTPDRYQKLVDFEARSFAPGETVRGWCELKDQDKPVAGVRVTAAADVDGRPVFVPQTVTGADGRARFRFALPPTIDRGDVKLRVTFHPAPRTEETLAKRVPVIGRQVVLEFFPEGGDLVAGVPNRVYLRATTPGGQPVDVTGTLTDGKRAVAAVETVSDPDQPGANGGLGVFTFTPELGAPYWVNLAAPAGLSEPLRAGGPPPVGRVAAAGGAAVAATRTGFPLPEVKPKGVVLTVPDGVTEAGRPLRVQLRVVGAPRELVVGACTRGRLMDTRRVSAEPGRVHDLDLMADPNPRGGVTRVTVFEAPPDDADTREEWKPVAERLVFRKPGERLNLAYTADGAAPFAPDAEVKLNFRATDEAGKPAAAVVWAAVVNQGVVGMADGRWDRLMTAHFLLAGEVKNPDELEHADFLLSDHPAAAAALDRLLGTQGWRRFAEQTSPFDTSARFLMRPAERERLLALNGQLTRGLPAALGRDGTRLHETYWPRYEEAVERLAAAAEAETLAKATRGAEPPDTATGPAAEAVSRAADRLDETERRAAGLRAGVWPGVGVLALAGCVVAVLAARRPWADARPRMAAAVALFAAAGALAAVDLSQPADEVRAKGAAEPVPVAPTPVVPTPVPPRSGSDQPPEVAAVTPTSAPVVVSDPTRDGARAGVAAAGGFGAAAAAPAGRPEAGDRTPPGAGLAAKADVAKGAVPAPPAPPTPPGAPAAAMKAAPADATPFADPKSRGKMNAGFGSGSGGGGFGALGGGGGGVGGPAGYSLGALGRRLATPEAEKQLQMIEKGAARPEPKPGAAGVNGVAADKPAGEARKAFSALDALRRNQNADAKAETLPRFPPGRLAEVAEQYFLRKKQAVPEGERLAFREFAHARPGADKDAAAEYQPVAETVLWQPLLVLPASGTAAVSFRLGGLPAGYQVLLGGHTPDGRIGATRGFLPVAPAPPPVTVSPATTTAPAKPK